MEYTKDMVLSVSEIDRQTARAFVEKYHYSKVMPRITKICIGGFWENDLVAVTTLGWGNRPLLVHFM